MKGHQPACFLSSYSSIPAEGAGATQHLSILQRVNLSILDKMLLVSWQASFAQNLPALAFALEAAFTECEPFKLQLLDQQAPFKQPAFPPSEQCWLER